MNQPVFSAGLDTTVPDVAGFKPPVLLRHRDVQTIASGFLRKVVIGRRTRSLQEASREQLLELAGGVKLVAWVTPQKQAAPTIVVIHGWLGSHSSAYVQGVAGALWDAGFSVVRLNLRDHGGTDHLNEGMFHNGLLEEAVEAVQVVTEGAPAVGLIGYSLGGNFALRICNRLGLPTLAVCPLIDPDVSGYAIDEGPSMYRNYFLSKWRGALRSKAKAFPGVYDFEAELRMRSIRRVTEEFVLRHSPYSSIEEYFSLYTLTDGWLDDLPATILAAADDPVCPAGELEKLPVPVLMAERGSHCAFMESWGMRSFVDRFAPRHFRSVFGG